MTDHSPVSDSVVSSERQAEQSPQKNFLRRGIIAAVTGGGMIAIIQLLAPEFDYQIAFLASAAIGLVSFVLTVYYLQRVASAAGHRWCVPVTTLALAIGFVSLVKVRTISGEMIPQFGWRFSSPAVPELQTTVVASDSAPSDSANGASDSLPGDDAANSEPKDGTAKSHAAPASQRGATWTQFLGNDRDGSIAQREFAIPKSAREVETLWNIGIGGGWSSFAISSGIAVTLEQREEFECVTAYRLADGELLWIVQHDALHTHPLGESGPRSTPTILADRVYAQGATGQVWCLELQTGDVLWQTNLLQRAGWDQAESEVAVTWGRSGSPLLVDGLCVLPYGGPDDVPARSLIALDADTGETRWTAGQDQISYSSPQLLTLGGRRQIVIVNESTISGHAIDSGAELWQTDWEGQSNGAANCAAVIPAGENRFLVGKGYGGGGALIEISANEAGDGFIEADVWRSSRVLKTKFNHAVVSRGIAYGLSNGALQAVEVESGQRLWEQSRRSRSGQGQVILVDDTLIVQEEMGDLILVAADPNEYRELLRIDALQHKTWNVPSLAGNLLLIRNSVQAMAIELPAK